MAKIKAGLLVNKPWAKANLTTISQAEEQELLQALGQASS